MLHLNKHNRKCFKKQNCGINGCSAKHHQLLHNIASSFTQSNNNQVKASINSHSTSSGTQLFRIIPIQLMKKNGYLKTYAFLDESSSVTLIEKEVFDLLGIDGVSEPLCLRWTGDTTRREDESVKHD